MRIVLYRREDCSLCDRAEEALRGAGVAFETFDVGWSGEEAERYGSRVPVLCCSETGAELDWPFDAWTVRKFLGMV